MLAPVVGVDTVVGFTLIAVDVWIEAKVGVGIGVVVEFGIGFGIGIRVGGAIVVVVVVVVLVLVLEPVDAMLTSDADSASFLGALVAPTAEFVRFPPTTCGSSWRIGLGSVEMVEVEGIEVGVLFLALVVEKLLNGATGNSLVVVHSGPLKWVGVVAFNGEIETSTGGPFVVVVPCSCFCLDSSSLVGSEVDVSIIGIAVVVVVATVSSSAALIAGGVVVVASVVNLVNGDALGDAGHSLDGIVFGRSVGFV